MNTIKTHSKFNLSTEDKFKRYKEAFLFFFYTDKSSGEVEVYLIRKSGGKYDCFKNDILDLDGNSFFSIARYFVENFRGVVTKKNLFLASLKEKHEAIKLNEYDNVHWSEYFTHPTYYSWLDDMSSNVIQFDAFDDEILFFIELEEKLNLSIVNPYFKSIGVDLEFSEMNESNKDDFSEDLRLLLEVVDVKKHINDTKNAIITDYFIILSCKPKSNDYQDQAGFFHFPSLLQGHYRRNNEKWLYMLPAENEFPDDEILKKTKCVIIPGSQLACYQDDDFLIQTRMWLERFHTNPSYGKVKFLGLCFGAQILQHSIGGLCVAMGKMILNTEEVFISDEFWELPFVKNSKVTKSKSLKITQLHGDEITTLANGFKNYGSSSTCKNEILVSDDLRYFLIQGHAEYHREFCITRIAPWKFPLKIEDRDQRNNEYNKLSQKFIAEKFEKETWMETRSLCYSFLKGN